jgi:hypothetical protein
MEASPSSSAIDGTIPVLPRKAAGLDRRSRRVAKLLLYWRAVGQYSTGDAVTWSESERLREGIDLPGALSVSPHDYARYRVLGRELLVSESWHEIFGLIGVALSRDGLTIFAERLEKALPEQLERSFGFMPRIRGIGPLKTAAQGGESAGAGSGRQVSGTFGCLVKDAHNAHFGLSCDHVVGTLAGQSSRDPVWAPGLKKGGSTSSQIGDYDRGSGVTLSTSASNKVDAALISLATASAHSQSVTGISGAPTGVNLSPSIGDKVKKSGAATGVTHGEYTYIITMNVPYHGGRARFVDQMGIDGGGTIFADEGDSGAVVLDDTDKVVGLLFAAAPQSYLGFANPIDDVFSALGVTLA